MSNNDKTPVSITEADIFPHSTYILHEITTPLLQHYPFYKPNKPWERIQAAYENYYHCLESGSIYNCAPIMFAIYTHDNWILTKHVIKFSTGDLNIHDSNRFPLLDIAYIADNKFAIKFFQGYSKCTFLGDEEISWIENSSKKVPSLQNLCGKILAAEFQTMESPEKIVSQFSDLETDVIQTVLQNIPIVNFKFIAKWHYWNHYTRIQSLKNPKDDNNSDYGNGLMPVSVFYKSVRIQEILCNLMRTQYIGKVIVPDLIFSVYNHYDLFQYAPLDVEASETRPTSGPCIVDHATFLRNFDAFTDGIFRDFSWEDPIMVYGGAIEACLRPVPAEHTSTFESLREYYAKKYPNSDIDVASYNGGFSALFLDHLKKNSQALLVGTLTNLTIVLQYPKRQVQCVQYFSSRDFEDILINTDVDCSGVAFDGKQVLMTHRAFIAFTHGFNIASQELRRIRGPINYEKRLLKYQQRGYSVVDFNIGEYSTEIAKFKKGIVGEKDKIMAKVKNDFNQLCREYPGITLLLLFEVFPELYQYLANPEGAIPWSPDYTVKSITQMFRNDSKFQEAYAANTGYYGETEIQTCASMWTASQDNQYQSDIFSLKVPSVNLEKILSPRSNWYEGLLMWCCHRSS